MIVVIDRFEGSYAVCEIEGREMVNIERSKLPPEAREGDVLVLGEQIVIDIQETERRRREIDTLTKDLWDS